MASTSDEAAMLGLRAQILDNIRIVQPEAKDPVVVTCFSKETWSAVVWANGQPEFGSDEGFKTVMEALRNLLEYTSYGVYEKVYFETDDESEGDSSEHPP